MPVWRNGRRNGLKIRWRAISVWVRVPPSVPAFDNETLTLFNAPKNTRVRKGVRKTPRLSKTLRRCPNLPFAALIVKHRMSTQGSENPDLHAVQTPKKRVRANRTAPTNHSKPRGIVALMRSLGSKLLAEGGAQVSASEMEARKEVLGASDESGAPRRQPYQTLERGLKQGKTLRS